MSRCQATEAGSGPCVLPPGPHASHYDGTTWWADPNVVVPTPGPGRRETVSGSRKILVEARRRTAPEDHPTASWTEERWLAHASEVMTEFLATRTEPFTTPEHLWPLLPDPLPDVDRRILVRLVRSALKAGLIREEGARRLRDTYRTADGTTFSINKLVPVYVVGSEW